MDEIQWTGVRGASKGGFTPLDLDLMIYYLKVLREYSQEIG